MTTKTDISEDTPHVSSLHGDVFKWRLPDCQFAMWAFDRVTGRVLTANAAACRLYGYPREELCQLAVDDICRSALGSLIGLGVIGTPQEETVWHRRRDGSTFQTSVSLLASSWSDLSATTLLVHPLILSRDGEASLTSMLPLMVTNGRGVSGPFPSLPEH